MNWLRLGLLVFITCDSAFVPNTRKTKEKQQTYIRAVFCNASSKYINPGYKSFAKSYNRSFSTYNVIATTKMPLYNISGIGRLFYRYGNIYREVLHTPHIDDVCGLMKTMKSDNILVQYIFTIYDQLAPGLIHECPYRGLNIRDANVKTDDYPEICPSGDYKYVVEGFIGKEFLVTATFIVTCTSALRENFG